MTYAFLFDASACSGCKSCQVACKDKNNLPVGVLWRRVYEVSGGTWQRQDQGWLNSVFAYNLSLACNHCVHPKCAGVCPTDAYSVRPDGIVRIDAQKCMGCGYCAWACPYDAPQYDRFAGVMTKCDLCYDKLDQGAPPACVASCPMRCLELVEISDQQTDGRLSELWRLPGEEHPFPLPQYSRTEPHLAILPHPQTKQPPGAASVGNREEVTPIQPSRLGRGELPLLIFTLLAQMAVGAFAGFLLVYTFMQAEVLRRQTLQLSMPVVGLPLAVALISAWFHLGNPKNAWRAVKHLEKSWLSREILVLSAFAGSWALLSGLAYYQIVPPGLQLILSAFTLASGGLLVFAMHNIYRLRSVPEWNTWRTLLEFSLSALILGPLIAALVLPVEVLQLALPPIAVLAGISMLAGLWITFSVGQTAAPSLNLLRKGLLISGILAASLVVILPAIASKGLLGLLFALAVLEEGIGRWLFYARRIPPI